MAVQCSADQNGLLRCISRFVSNDQFCYEPAKHFLCLKCRGALIRSSDLALPNIRKCYELRWWKEHLGYKTHGWEVLAWEHEERRGESVKVGPYVQLLLILGRSLWTWTSPSGEFSQSPWPWTNTSPLISDPCRLLLLGLIFHVTSEASPWAWTNVAVWPVTCPLTLPVFSGGIRSSLKGVTARTVQPLVKPTPNENWQHSPSPASSSLPAHWAVSSEG